MIKSSVIQAQLFNRVTEFDSVLLVLKRELVLNTLPSVV